MKKRKIASLLLAGLLTISMGVTTVYATEDEIAAVQAQKEAAQSELAQTQANIGSMESKKQELEGYLADLNAQYEELTQSIAQLSIEAGEKEEQLKQLRSKLKKAKKASDEQYEAMKIRIAYMYEKGGTNALAMLLSSENFADFLNQAENISQISQYDRDMLKKYEELQNSIKIQETSVKEEAEAVNAMMSQKASMQQEVQYLAAETSDSISSYMSQISASEAEVSALMNEISSADSSIAALVQQAEAEKAAQEAAAQADEEYLEDYGYDSDEYSEDSYGGYESSDDSGCYEEESYGQSAGSSSSDEGAYDESAGSSETSSDSSGGKYLGNFVLTAYCNCAQCCGTAGNLTASGTVPASGRTVAMAGVPFGTQLLINGNIYTVEDLGTPYGHVDIFFDNHSDALSFGLQHADVYQVG